MEKTNELLHPSIEKIEIKDAAGRSVAEINDNFVYLPKGYTARIKSKKKEN